MLASTQLTIDKVKHPWYSSQYRDWEKWRYTYEGGRQFIDRYLKQYSSREKHDSFLKRKEISYNPAFAASAVNEIKNSIFQRLVDITRQGGSNSYMDSVQGLEGGVDLVGNSMNSFLGCYILPELLSMARVGIFVDMPRLEGDTQYTDAGKRPYLYRYRTEDIRSWCLDQSANYNEYNNILLQDTVNEYDPYTKLPIGTKCRYRHMWIAEDGFVHVQYYDEDSYEDSDEEILTITRIPFVVLQLEHSLLVDAADYQIALLNLASSDISYAINSNFPFYTEQYDPVRDNMNLRQASQSQGGEAKDANTSKDTTVTVGVGDGRRYSAGMERPGFIHPSPEPLQVSMQKQEQLKLEIRHLVHLSTASLNPRFASAESKGMDNQALEAGLSYIGLELEAGERKIADYWSMYENSNKATVNYPKKYSLKTDADRRAEAKSLSELQAKVPSKRYQKKVSLMIAKILLENNVSTEEFDAITSEIEAAKGITSEQEAIAKDVEASILDLELASELRGYPPGTVEKAATEHAERLKRIMLYQSKDTVRNGAARGVDDIDPEPLSSPKKEKQE